MLNESQMHGYQRAAVHHAHKHTHCAMFLGMGLGKTVSSLTLIRDLIDIEMEVRKVLVIAPKAVAESVWHKEVSNWAHVKHLRVSRVTGNEKQRLTALAADADIYTLGVDNTAWLCGLYGGSKSPFDMLIIDESSCFKNHASVRFKALKLLQPSFKRIVELTGTPASNGLIDLWPQMWLLDRGQRLGKTITAYREAYFRKDYTGFKYLPSQGVDALIHGKIADICISMSAEDYLTLPPVIHNRVMIAMPPDVRKGYFEFERDQVLKLAESGAEITALNGAALSDKLLQYASGSVYDEDRGVHKIHSLKIDALADIVEAAQGQPVLVAYAYKHGLDAIMEGLARYKPVQRKTDAHVDAWNAGAIPVMVMHPKSGGHGLNLQAGGHIIVWMGPTWSLELYQQFNTRVHRQGQKETVVINHLLVEGTMDMDVVKAQESKDDVQKALLDAVKLRIKKYVK